MTEQSDLVNNGEWTFEKLLSEVKFQQTPQIFMEVEEGSSFRFVKREIGENIADIGGHRVSGDRIYPEPLVRCAQGEGTVLYHGKELEVVVPDRLTRTASKHNPHGAPQVLVRGGKFTVIDDPTDKLIAFLDPPAAIKL